MTPIGWKIGLNVPAVQQALGLTAPAVAPLPGPPLAGPVSISGWALALAEPEISIELRRDVEPGTDAGTALAAIESLGGAIELVDIDLPLDDLAPILAGGIFHRGVAFGPTRQDVALSGVEATLTIAGEHVASAHASSVDLAETIIHVANETAADGGLRAGQRIIAGSLTTPAPVKPGDIVHCDFGPLGEVALDIEEDK